MTPYIIYECPCSSKFREECVKLYQSLCRKVCTTQWQGDVIVETPKTQMLLTQRSEYWLCETKTYVPLKKNENMKDLLLMISNEYDFR